MTGAPAQTNRGRNAACSRGRAGKGWEQDQGHVAAGCRGATLGAPSCSAALGEGLRNTDSKANAAWLK